jgi:DinB superfamily
MDDWDRPSSRPLREIPRDGDNHAFLLKALHEASGELEGEFYNLRRAQLAWHEPDGWSLAQIAGHLRDREQMHLDYLRGIVSSRDCILEAIDFEAMVDENGYGPEEAHNLLYGYAELRERALYTLYNLSGNQWRRTGRHPYRGSLSIEQIVKEMNEHDLAHLWQVKRLKAALSAL